MVAQQQNSLRADGFHVFVSDILTAEAQTTVDEINKSGGSAEFIWLDVTDQLSVDRAFDVVSSKTSSLTGVINNAGIAHSQPLEKLTDAQWDLTMNVDLKGMMRVCRAVTDNPRYERDRVLSFVFLLLLAPPLVGTAMFPM